MKEIVKLSNGDLYCTSAVNVLPGVYDEHYKLITKLTPSTIVLLIDDRYFRAIFGTILNSTFVYSYYFVPCKNLKEANRKSDSFDALYVKIAYNSVVGYINTKFLTTFTVEKQS